MSHPLTLTFLIFFIFEFSEMAILPKVLKSDNFKLQNSIEVSFTNIEGHRSNFFGCESFLNSNSPDIPSMTNSIV